LRPLAIFVGLAALGCASVHTFLDPRGPRYAGEPADTAPDEEPQLRVVAFNIAYAEDVAGALAHLRGDPELRSADVLLLQEMDAEGSAAIARALGMHWVYYPASRRGDGGGFGNAVLSRWSIVEDHKIVLPHASWINGQRRIGVAATLDAPGGRIAVVSVHTETALVSLRTRYAQLSRVLADVDERYPHLPVVIGGDFNTPERWALQRLDEGFASRGFRPATRAVDATADYPVIGALVLDHVFVRGLDVLAAGTVRTSASDHHAIHVLLER
jgi:endonuclease/exonuclease/phosphatase (EEP) superfamily protein YafD